MGKRLVARIIDGLVLSVAFLPLYLVLVAGSGSQTIDPVTGQVDAGAAGAAVGGLIVYYLIAFLVQVAYEGSMIALRGATVGKQVMKIRVVREDGQLPGWGPALVRWLIPFGGLFVCGVGQLVVYLSPFFDGSKRYQGWHDKVAKTFVVVAA
jgi:uncharacterized RDD family membrane protein YckC